MHFIILGCLKKKSHTHKKLILIQHAVRCAPAYHKPGMEYDAAGQVESREH